MTNKLRSIAFSWLFALAILGLVILLGNPPSPQAANTTGQPQKTEPAPKSDPAALHLLFSQR